MSYLANPSDWALGYVRGRADAFRRGTLTIAYVLGAARKAVALGVSHSDVGALLTQYGLTWDVENDALCES